ncbi:MAG: hypothetical protein GY799_24385 [Desulfobulbaceae bacterium]|nr:hypothetical protein [Desulfobulbaceae bacterium]
MRLFVIFIVVALMGLGNQPNAFADEATKPVVHAYLQDVEDLPPYSTADLTFSYFPLTYDFMAEVKNISKDQTYTCDTWNGNEYIPMGTIPPGDAVGEIYKWEHGQPGHAYDEVNIRCIKDLTSVLGEVSFYDLKDRRYQKGYVLRLDAWNTVKWRHPNQFFGPKDIKTLRCIVGPANSAWKQPHPVVDIPANGTYSDGFFTTNPMSWYTAHTKECSIVEAEPVQMGEIGQVRVKDGHLEMALRIPLSTLEGIAKEDVQLSSHLQSMVVDVRPVNDGEELKDAQVLRFIVDKNVEYSGWQQIPWKDDFKYELSLYGLSAIDVIEQGMRFKLDRGEIYWSFVRPEEFKLANIVSCSYGFPQKSQPDSIESIGSILVPRQGFSSWIKGHGGSRGTSVRRGSCTAY